MLGEYRCYILYSEEIVHIFNYQFYFLCFLFPESDISPVVCFLNETEFALSDEYRSKK